MYFPFLCTWHGSACKYSIGEMKEVSNKRKWLNSKGVKEVQEVHITLTFYLEIKDSEVYGGVGEVGYAEQKMDLLASDLSNVKLLDTASNSIKGFAEICGVSTDKVRIISRSEYEDNVEDKGKDICISLA